MIPGLLNSTWVSQAYSQGAGENSWKDYQTELQVVPEEIFGSSLYYSLGGTTSENTIIKYTNGTFEIVNGGRVKFVNPDLAAFSYASKSFSVGTQDGTPTGLAFSTDGTKMYVVGQGNDTVYQYTLTTAWDVSTASYASKSFSVNAQETSPQDVAFSTDGTKMYVVGQTNRTVYQYTLTTAWDVSTASYVKGLSVSTQDSIPTGLAFSLDGTKMYVVGQGNDTVYQYNSTQTSSTTTVQVSSISVSDGKTTLGTTAASGNIVSVTVDGRSSAQDITSCAASGNDLVCKSDRIALPSGKRYAKFQIVGDYNHEPVTAAKINLWTE